MGTINKEILFWVAIIILLLLTPLFSNNNGKSEIVIDDIIITNNYRTKKYIIKKYCRFAIGDNLSKRELAKNIRITTENLKNTYYFDDVQIIPKYFDHNKVKIIIIINESSFPFRISGGNIYGGIERFNHHGRAFNDGIEIGLNRFSLYISNQWVKSSSFGYFNQIILEKTDKMSIGFRDFNNKASFSTVSLNCQGNYSFTPRNIVFLALNYQNNLKIDKILSPNFYFRKEINIDERLSIIGKLLFDHRNNRWSPEKGIYVKYQIELGNTMRENNLYYRTILDVRTYNKLGDNVLFMRGFYGYCKGHIPFLRLFHIDDIRKIRIPGMDIYDGYKTMYVNTELRHNLFTFNSIIFKPWIEISAFSDFAVISEKIKPLNLDNMKIGFGPIIRLHIPPPVFVDIDFELGLSKAGKRFYFGVRKNL